MDRQGHTVKLYSAQTRPVLDVIRREGVCWSRTAYVRAKYGESAPVFLTAYTWFTQHMPAYVPKPAEAEFPYWAFMDLYSVEASGADVLTLEVPAEEAVFFDAADWTRIMQLNPLTDGPAEDAAFRDELRRRGLTPSDVMLTAFYPELKAAVLASWERLFRHHEAIRAGDRSGVGSVQAGLWQIRREWIVSGPSDVFSKDSI